MSTGLSLIKTLCRQGARSSFRRINPAHFTSEERPVYDFVADYYRRYGQLPTDEALRDQGHNLRLIRDNETADYYIDRLGDRYVVLRARNVIQTLQQAVVRGDAPEIREMIAALNGELRQVETGGSVISLSEALDQVLANYEQARLSPGIQGTTFGYDYLDEMTGGIQDGDVVTVAARTGLGKSYFLNQFAMSAWRTGTSVLLVSMEMTAIQMTTRLLAQYSRINPELIRRGQLPAWSHERLYAEVRMMQGGAPFTIVDGSFRLGVADVDNLVQEFNPDVVYIDAAYLLIPEQTRFSAKGWELQREMSKEVKRMAMARNKGFVQTVQLNRDAVKRQGSRLRAARTAKSSPGFCGARHDLPSGDRAKCSARRGLTSPRTRRRVSFTAASYSTSRENS